MNRRQGLGKAGEEAAALFLEAKGHVLLECNYRFEHKEIDVVSLCGDILVFTEIKTRSSYGLGYPEEAVHVYKQQFLKEAAAHYCNLNPQYQKLRFDVISILMRRGRVMELLHFEDAFY
jgi:putative endonuclease